MVRTRLAISFPVVTFTRIARWSGLAIKRHFVVGVGLVDSNYRGDMGVVRFNHANDFHVRQVNSIAQLILEEIAPSVVQEVQDLDRTSGGSSGFGSIGIQSDYAGGCKEIFETMSEGLYSPINFKRIDPIRISSLKPLEACRKLYTLYRTLARQELERIRTSKIYGRLHKWEFLKDRVEYTGCDISSVRFHVSPEKVKSVVGRPSSQAVYDVRPFLGLTTYYRCFIK